MDKDVKIVHDWVRERFKAKRKEMNLSIRELAAAAGVDYALVDEFERKGRDIRLSKLIAIAQALNIDLFSSLRVKP